jgi:hypothetical protein
MLPMKETTARIRNMVKNTRPAYSLKPKNPTFPKKNPKSASMKNINDALNILFLLELVLAMRVPS